MTDVRVSLSRAAINKGWGMRGLAIHPEFLMKGPYGTVRTRNPSRGGKKMCGRGGLPTTKKGIARQIAAMKVAKALATKKRLTGKGYDTAALTGCGYDTAALNGCGYDTAALDGCGYDTAALDGCGYETAALSGAGTFDELVNTLMKTLGGSGTKLVKMIADKLNMSLKELLENPEMLMAALKRVAPHVQKIVKKVYDWWKKRRSAKKPKMDVDEDGDEEDAFTARYMRQLKKDDPEAYQRLYRKYQRDAWLRYQREHRKQFLYDEDGEDEEGEE